MRIAWEKTRPRHLAGTPAPISRRRLLRVIAGAAAGTAVSTVAWSDNARTPDTLSPAQTGEFLAAIKAGNRQAATAMLDENAALTRATDERGRSAYILAHLSGHPEIAALLADRGLELDVVEAVLAADWDRVEKLAAENPAVMNAAHPIGGTPLYASALVGGAKQYRLRALGAEPDGRPPGGSGFTPARAAMDCADPVGAWLAAIDLLGNGGHVNVRQAHGDSVLHGAVRARDTRLVRLVIRKGGDVEARDDKGRTPLELAEALEWREGVELLRNEASIARDHRGSRFAFNAGREPFRLLPIDDIPTKLQNETTGSSHFDLERVRELLDEEPRLIHALSTDAELAIEACSHTGRRDIIRLHLDRGAPLSLPTAIGVGDLDHARWLLRRDPLLVNERGAHDFPVMWYPSIARGSVAAAEMLLQFGASLEQESGGETLLHRAAARGQTDLIDYLASKGANLQAVGYRKERAGTTPLELAIANDQGEAIRLLRELGA